MWGFTASSTTYTFHDVHDELAIFLYNQGHVYDIKTYKSLV